MPGICPVPRPQPQYLESKGMLRKPPGAGQHSCLHVCVANNSKTVWNNNRLHCLQLPYLADIFRMIHTPYVVGWTLYTLRCIPEQTWAALPRLCPLKCPSATKPNCHSQGFHKLTSPTSPNLFLPLESSNPKSQEPPIGYTLQHKILNFNVVC